MPCGSTPAELGVLAAVNGWSTPALADFRLGATAHRVHAASAGAILRPNG
jgi:hypothetical protein